MPTLEYDLRSSSHSLSIVNKAETLRKGNYLESYLIKER